MKKITILLISLILITSCINKSETTKSADKQLRHVVLFKFKKETNQTAIKEIENAFINLPSKIEAIKNFEWGLNNSSEGLNKGFTHCFFVTFDSKHDRDQYLPHPAHTAFVTILKPHLEDVLVLDYWTK